MKMDIRIVVVVSLYLLLGPRVLIAQTQQTANTLKLEESAPRPQATIEDVGLLIGHWKGEFLGAMAEEFWLPAAGNSMLGVFRLYGDEGVLFYETMILVEEEESVSLKLKHFHPDLTGWEEKEEVVTFRLVKADKNALWFEGLTFRMQPDGSLKGFIALRQDDGSVEEQSFVYLPVGTQ